jgi:hypothetical protein
METSQIGQKEKKLQKSNMIFFCVSKPHRNKIRRRKTNRLLRSFSLPPISCDRTQKTPRAMSKAKEEVTKQSGDRCMFGFFFLEGRIEKGETTKKTFASHER